MDWIVVAKAALAVYLVVSVGYVVVVYRRRRRNRTPVRPVRPEGYQFGARWGFAPTPLPEWAYLDEDAESEVAQPDPQRSARRLAGAGLGEGEDRGVELICDAVPFLPRRRRR